jgi:hypothetical protein
MRIGHGGDWFSAELTGLSEKTSANISSGCR